MLSLIHLNAEVLVGPEVLQRLEQCEQLHKDRLVQAMLRVAT